MIIKRTESLEFGKSLENIKNERQDDKEPQQEIGIQLAKIKSQQARNPRINKQMSQKGPQRKSELLYGKQAFPQSIIQSIKKSKKQVIQAKIGHSALGYKIKQSLNIYKNCQICEQPMKRQERFGISKCEHQFNFCQSCLHHYVIYKVQSFQEVHCPANQCEEIIDVTSFFFKSLPADIQKKYRKVHNFYLTSKDPTLKLCPGENCQGVIKLIQGQPFVCSMCLKLFCEKCYLQKHEGTCDRQELNLFQNNFKYRQCRRCKFVIEKNQGCNHMTCKCGYQFCYICGKRWSSDHVCENPNAPINHDDQQNGPLCLCCCFEGHCCCECCDCCQDEQECTFICRCMRVCLSCRGANQICGETCGNILRCPVKGIVIGLLTLLLLLILLTKDLFVFFVGIILCFFAGTFGFSIEFLCQIGENQGCIPALILLVLFPICIIYGIFKAFRQIFFQMLSTSLECTMQFYCQIVNEVMHY